MCTIKRLGLILIYILTHSTLTQADTRSENDKEAKAAFHQLHFFSEGRGMIMSPNMISIYDSVFRPEATSPQQQVEAQGIRNRIEERWGLSFTDERVNGLYSVDYKDMKIGTVGCVACHSGKAAGRYIIGLGAKNIDVLIMAKDLHRTERWWKVFGKVKSEKSDEYKDIEKAAMEFSSYLSTERIGNLTQGLVPVSFIRGWFYKMQGENIPKGATRGQVKIPFLWGYGEKRKVGQFCDGYGNGNEVGWAVAVELTAGQTPEAVRNYYPKVVAAEKLFEEFLPPAYPFEINQKLANAGEALFNTTCARCHGTYEHDKLGHPIYKAPKWIPHKVVRTDSDRLDGNTDAFNALVDNNPLSNILSRTNHGRGYFAPRLEGVWSRFPYLHNASVPNIKSLLSKPSERPKVFSLKDAGEEYRFDPKALGLTLPKSKREIKKLMRAGARGERNVYDTRRVGHSQQGHDFYTDLAEADKLALIEYLKTL